MKIERILLPTDFSDHSLAALKYAVELAREHESEVVLVHVVEPLPYGIARWHLANLRVSRRKPRNYTPNAAASFILGSFTK